MATYLIDCGPGPDLLELARRVVAHLGPEAALARSTDLVYGGADLRGAGADVFIGLQSTGINGSEMWVHPRSSPRSRVLADTLRSEMTRHGAGGTARTGDLSVLAPERHAPGAAACVLEVDDRLRGMRDPVAVDGVAQAIARAARNARYGARSATAMRAPARGLDDAPLTDDPQIRPFYDLVVRAGSDSAFRERLLADPAAVLAELGMQIPAEIAGAFFQHLREIVQARPVAAAQAWSRSLEAPEITAEVRFYGVVFALNNQATSDLVNGSNVIAGLLAAAAAATAIPAPEAAAVLGVLSGYIWAQSAVIALANRGNGVYLHVPWTSLLPPPLGAPIVFPTPR